MNNENTTQALEKLLQDLTGEIRQGLARPIYIRVSKEHAGLAVKQVSFLTPARLAELAHVTPRTVYGWIEKSQENGLKFYRPPGTSGILFEINEALDWIMTAEPS
jgi:hypothetical protein